MSLRLLIAPALAALIFAAAPAQAAPITPLPGLSELTPVETVQRRFGWRDHPLMYSDNWYWHNRAWDAREGRGGVRTTSCARLRGYDRRTHTYLNRSGRRVACR